MPRRKRGQPLTRIEKLLRSDGALCVTFVNTAAPERRGFDSYDDLLAWSVEVGVLDDADRRRLSGVAADNPGKAAGVARRARTLRGRLHRILLAFAGAGKSDGADFEAFNHELGAALAARRLTAGAGVCQWSWGARDGDDLDRMLWPVLLSAAELLASPAVRRLRRCAGKSCEKLFVARASGRPRKWCSIACGNRSTTSRYYHETLKPRREKAG